MSLTKKNSSTFEQSRRQFLTKTLPISAFCLGCGNLVSSVFAGEKPEVKSAQHKYLENSGMSFQQVFDFTFKQIYIPTLKTTEKEIGKEKLIEILKIVSSEGGKKSGQNLAQSLGKNDMISWATALKDYEFYNNILSYEIIEETTKAFEIKYTECLFAKTFREADASDIGYAAVCHTDYAFTSAYNPVMKLNRTKTLMQGNDCCNFRWVMEA